jgi:hypothetical protein
MFAIINNILNDIIADVVNTKHASSVDIPVGPVKITSSPSLNPLVMVVSFGREGVWVPRANDSPRDMYAKVYTNH